MKIPVHINNITCEIIINTHGAFHRFRWSESVTVEQQLYLFRIFVSGFAQISKYIGVKSNPLNIKLKTVTYEVGKSTSIVQFQPNTYV